MFKNVCTSKSKRKKLGSFSQYLKTKFKTFKSMFLKNRDHFKIACGSRFFKDIIYLTTYSPYQILYFLKQKKTTKNIIACSDFLKIRFLENI